MAALATNGMELKAFMTGAAKETPGCISATSLRSRRKMTLLPLAFAVAESTGREEQLRKKADAHRRNSRALTDVGAMVSSSSTSRSPIAGRRAGSGILLAPLTQISNSGYQSIADEAKCAAAAVVDRGSPGGSLGEVAAAAKLTPRADVRRDSRRVMPSLSLCVSRESPTRPPMEICETHGDEQLRIRVPVESLERTLIASIVFGQKELNSAPSTPTRSDLSTSGGASNDDEPLSPGGASACSNAGSSVASADENGYDMGEVLGSGSMACVYKVRQRSDGQEFAAKCVCAPDAESRVVLKQEYEILKYGRHDNVVQAHAFCENKGDIWLVLELCSDGNVEDYVHRQGPLPERRARVLARQLMDAVDFLHCRRVVHRDVKPANLLLQHHAEVLKLADFHIARRLGTQSGSCLMMLSHRGTPLYCAPELRFDRQWNERVDIWATGLSIFFMLRAALPFDAASRRANKLLKQGRMPPVVWGDVAEPPRNFLQQCFTVDMRDRPPALVLLLHPWLSKTLVTGSHGTADREPGAFLPACGILENRAHCSQNVADSRRASSRACGRAEALRHLSASYCTRTSPGTRSNLTAVGAEAWHTSPV